MAKTLSRANFPRLIATLAAGAALAAGSPAGAQDAKKAEPAAAAAPAGPTEAQKKEARKAYAEGEKSFGAGQFAAAYVSFKKAYEAAPSPHALYWMALALDKQADRPKETLAAYDAYFAHPAYERLGDEKVAGAKARWEELKKSPGELSIKTAPPGATVIVDGQAQMGETPLTVKLPGGSHKVAISATGFETKEMDIEVKAFDSVSQEITLSEKIPEPAAAPPVVAPVATEKPVEAPPAKPREPKSKVPAYVTLGLAGAGAVVGTIFGLKAMSAKSDFNDAPTSKGADDVERNALIADMAFGVAITLGVTGFVLLSSDDSGEAKSGQHQRLPQARSKVRVAPFATPHSAGAAAGWTF